MRTNKEHFGGSRIVSQEGRAPYMNVKLHAAACRPLNRSPVERGPALACAKRMAIVNLVKFINIAATRNHA
jgi:hypothetical protein